MNMRAFSVDFVSTVISSRQLMIVHDYPQYFKIKVFVILKILSIYFFSSWEKQLQLAVLLKSEWRGHSETQHETQRFQLFPSQSFPLDIPVKIARIITMGGRKRREPLPYYAFKMAPDFRGRLEIGRIWRIWLSFALLPFPSFPARLHFSLSPASR